MRNASCPPPRAWHSLPCLPTKSVIIEVRALGCLIEDLLAYVDASAYVSASIGPEHYRKLSAIKDEGMQLDVTQRPCFAEVKKAIKALLKGK